MLERLAFPQSILKLKSADAAETAAMAAVAVMALVVTGAGGDGAGGDVCGNGRGGEGGGDGGDADGGGGHCVMDMRVVCFFLFFLLFVRRIMGRR